MRSVYTAFYLSIVIGFARSILRKVLSAKSRASSGIYYLIVEDIEEPALKARVAMIKKPPHIPDCMDGLASEFINVYNLRTQLRAYVVPAEELDWLPPEIDAENNPFSHSINRDLWNRAVKLSCRYSWFKPEIYHR